jgi:hypothetical protein
VDDTLALFSVQGIFWGTNPGYQQKYAHMAAVLAMRIGVLVVMHRWVWGEFSGIEIVKLYKGCTKQTLNEKALLTIMP